MLQINPYLDNTICNSTQTRIMYRCNALMEFQYSGSLIQILVARKVPPINMINTVDRKFIVHAYLFAVANKVISFINIGSFLSEITLRMF